MPKRFRHIPYKRYVFLALAFLLLSFSYIFSKYFAQPSSVAREKKQLENYIHRQQRDFEKLILDTATIRKLLRQKESLEELEVLAKKPYGFYIVLDDSESSQRKLVFWSDQNIMPGDDVISLLDGEYFRTFTNGSYILEKRSDILPGSSREIVAYAYIPIVHKYFIETDYLPETFAYSKTAMKRVSVTNTETAFPIRTLSGKTQFYLAKRAFSPVPVSHLGTIILRFSGLFFLLLFIQLFAEHIAEKRSNIQGVLFLAGALIGLRLLTYALPTLLDLRQFELFDPSIYGSNMLFQSLGDLLINAILFTWIVMFASFKTLTYRSQYGQVSLVRKRIVGTICLALLIVATILFADIIKSMVRDSDISFDVTNFFSLTIYSVVGLVIIACLSLGYYYFSHLLFEFIFAGFEKNKTLAFFLIGVFALTYLTLQTKSRNVQFHLLIVVWLLLYAWLVNQREFYINRFRINIAGVVFWIVAFSISISAIIMYENTKKEWENRQAMAEKMATSTDESREDLLSVAMAYIDNDFLKENFNRFRAESAGKAVRDSIVNENFRGYSETYDTRLYLFDELNNPLFNEDPTTYDALNTILQVQARETRVDGLYYYETNEGQSAYITRREVIDSADTSRLGSLFIVSTLKKYNSVALLPELFKKQKKDDPENSPIYSIAMYKDRVLKSTVSKYAFPTLLAPGQVPGIEAEKRINGDYDELWYKAGNDKVVVIARKRNFFIESITLFSWIFCFFLFLVVAVEFASLLVKAGKNYKEVLQIWKVSIRNQVHSTIILISVVSFLIIGVATISFFISRYNRNNADKLSNTMRIMVNEMEKKMDGMESLDELQTREDSTSFYALQRLVNEVADIHSVDVNVYDMGGDLQVTSQSFVYRRGILSDKINPEAYYHLNRLRQVQHIQQEQLAELNYLSIYAPVRDNDGNPYAYLNIPYFTSQADLNQEISNFIITIINLNAFIFLIAGVIAFFVTNRITRSFSLISEKMREVNLGKMNEAIEWNRKDELGELVAEYNKMVAKLEASASALAKSEREGAWREMARQVAHEIKNPLTPMKLSIQYLQKAINANSPNVKELTSNVANTLVEQIDHLSKIAADFSQFANIGNIEIEKFDLHEVIYSLKELYRPDHRVDFIWVPLDRQVMLNADKTQMNRLFTNLFQNAVEACSQKEDCVIEVREEQDNGRVHVSVRDNGEGIPPEMRSKIFVPNFTTKSSGTGLGLAMCKGIVEQAKGEIWFETREGSGTTFHIELPVAE